MNLFLPVPHEKYPSQYDICKETGVCFYKPAKKREYTENYFLEEFKNQYQKTYYEDESNLRKLANKRLNILESFLKPQGKTLFEIGCATGFFLSEAAARGFSVSGIEISQQEVEYANQKLGLDVSCGNFLEYPVEKTFDVVAAFFVVEHFQEQEEVFRKIFSMLKKGGLLFLAIPSLYGPTYQTNPEEWFRTHPGDHFVDYSHISLRKLFSKFNTDILYNRPMSYHPGRDNGWRGTFPVKLFYKVIADMTCYGDTIQVLAKKK